MRLEQTKKLLTDFQRPIPDRIHFLCIGKTGCLAIRSALEDIGVAREYEFVPAHEASIEDIPKGEKVVLFLGSRYQGSPVVATRESGGTSRDATLNGMRLK